MTRRFDRQPRRHLLSAAGALDVDFRTAVVDYAELGRLALLLSRGDLGQAAALVRRAAFNVVMGNDDDHLKNHAWLYDGTAWALSPAYDLTWSPLAFAMAITTAVVPGASWSAAVAPGLGSAAILAGTGWALDTIFKPRVTVQRRAENGGGGSWWAISPLLVLLALFGITVGGLHELTGIRIVGVVMVVVPVIAALWAAIQHAGSGLELSPARRLRDYLVQDLAGYRGEITLLMMAGYIGTVGAPLLVPLVARSGLDPALLPTIVVKLFRNWLAVTEVTEVRSITATLEMEMVELKSNPSTSTTSVLPPVPPSMKSAP